MDTALQCEVASQPHAREVVGLASDSNLELTGVAVIRSANAAMARIPQTPHRFAADMGCSEEYWLTLKAWVEHPGRHDCLHPRADHLGETVEVNRAQTDHDHPHKARNELQLEQNTSVC